MNGGPGAKAKKLLKFDNPHSLNDKPREHHRACYEKKLVANLSHFSFLPLPIESHDDLISSHEIKAHYSPCGSRIIWIAVFFCVDVKVFTVLTFFGRGADPSRCFILKIGDIDSLPSKFFNYFLNSSLIELLQPIVVLSLSKWNRKQESSTIDQDASKFPQSHFEV